MGSRRVTVGTQVRAGHLSRDRGGVAGVRGLPWPAPPTRGPQHLAGSLLKNLWPPQLPTGAGRTSSTQPWTPCRWRSWPWSSRSSLPWSSALGNRPPTRRSRRPHTVPVPMVPVVSWPLARALLLVLRSFPLRWGRHRAARAVPRCPARGAGLGDYTGGILADWLPRPGRASTPVPGTHSATPGCATVWLRWPRRFRRPRTN